MNFSESETVSNSGNYLIFYLSVFTISTGALLKSLLKYFSFEIVLVSRAREKIKSDL